MTKDVTPDEIRDKIRQMHVEGYSIRKIMEKLDVSYDTVRSYAYQRVSNQITQSQYESVLEWLEKGTKMTRISVETGVSYPMVNEIKRGRVVGGGKPETEEN